MGRSSEVLAVHERMLAASGARSSQLETRSGGRVHVVETGVGPPVLLLHGSGTSSLSLLPLLDHLQGVRAIAVDRPGFGLSEPASVPRLRFRDAAVEFVDEIVDLLGLDVPVVAGQSMGGTWALWYALARPDRIGGLALVGSAPLLPDTRAPGPLRLMAMPVVGDVVARIAKPNPKAVVRLMSSMGERETIVRYPDLIDAIVAAGSDPVAAAANLAELRAAISPFGFRRALRVRPDELRRLTAPTLVIWGDRDPVGTTEAGEEMARLVSEARLEVLPGGHVPYLGHPERVAELLSEFVRSPGVRVVSTDHM
jgi:pimeloyl-ACP methyl ester carboxylesterase